MQNITLLLHWKGRHLTFRSVTRTVTFFINLTYNNYSIYCSIKQFDYSKLRPKIDYLLRCIEAKENNGDVVAVCMSVQYTCNTYYIISCMSLTQSSFQKILCTEQ